MVEATFRDPEHEAQLRREGYVHVPMFGPDEVAELRAVHAGFHQGDEIGFVSDIDWAEPHVRRALSEHIAPYWSRVGDRYLTPHRSLVTGFVTKWPGPEGLLPPHVHFTYVDPDRYRSIVAWLALDDADDALDNGPLRVLPTSHMVADEYFGSGTRPWYVDHLEAIDDAMITVPTRAGDLVVMDGRLVHGSRVSRADGPRIALLDEAVPAGADLFHPVGTTDGDVELHPVPDDVLMDAEPGLVARIFAYHHAPIRDGEDRPEPTPLARADGSGPVVLGTRRPLDIALLDHLLTPPPAAPATPAARPAAPQPPRRGLPSRRPAWTRRPLAWLASQRS